jgi:lipoprotein-anchoring transpeptidase ErfK/SrfK
MSSHKNASKVRGAQPLAVDAVAKAKPSTTSKKTPVEALAAPAPHSHHLVRGALYITLALIGVVAAVWLAGNLYLAKYKVGNNTVYAHLSDVRLQNLVGQAAQTYKLTLTDSAAGKPAQQFSLQTMGLHADAKATVVALRHQQHTLASRLEWWRVTPMSLVTTVDQAAFTAFINQHIAAVTQAPKDATLTVDNGTVQIVNGATGKAYGLASPEQTVLNAVAQLHAAPLQRHIVTAEPAITAKTLQHTKTEVEQTLHQHIALSADGQTVVPNATDIANWLDLKPNDAAKTLTVSVNKDHVQDYVNQVASDHSHPPRVQIRLANGNVIPGANGTTFTNQQDVSDHIAQQLLSGKGLQISLDTQHTPFRTIAAGGSTGKWLEVDLTTKRMYAFSGTSLQRTFLVSAGKAGTPTVTGQFAIYSKYARQTMTGANADGSNYIQPDVPWVNYFYRDYAIHGNYWRPASYFGAINSSHGCVGVQDNDALWVYTWAPIGTPVVIHT